MNNAKQFEWERYPNAEKIIVSLCQEVLNKNSEFRHLADSMHRGVSLNILDWIDHFRRKNSLITGLKSSP